MSKAAVWLTTSALGALVISGSALAADLPVKAKPIVAATFDWSGVYVGVHAGYGGGMKSWETLDGAFVARGALVGGQIGINKQLGSLVVGVELDGAWADITGAQRIAVGGPGFPFFQSQNDRSRIDGIGMLTGRAGLAADRWFVFMKGGLAVLHEKHDFSQVSRVGPIDSTSSLSGDETRLAPVLGFGTEYALGGNWSIKGEYNYIHVDAKAVRLNGTGVTNGVVNTAVLDSRVEEAIHLVKLGVNYRWGNVAIDPAYAAAPPAPGNNWSGGYIGVQGGYGWGSKQWPASGAVFTTIDPASYDMRGWLGGGTIGANAQAGSFVFGVEGEILGTGITGSLTKTTTPPGATVTTSYASKIDWLALATARAGFVVGGNGLLYGKGGVAIAQESHDLNVSITLPAGGGTVSTVSARPVHTGVVAGVGGEYAFTPNWSVKVEYDYLRMFQQSVVATGTGVANLNAVSPIDAAQIFNKVNQDLHLVKFGVNYHFNPLPVVIAKY